VTALGAELAVRGTVLFYVYIIYDRDSPLILHSHSTLGVGVADGVAVTFHLSCTAAPPRRLWRRGPRRRGTAMSSVATDTTLGFKPVTPFV